VTRKKTFRLRFTFWLDMLNGVEQDLADYIEELKSARTFAKTIRDGLRLIRDLRAGHVEVLFELFPWIRTEFIAGIMPKPDASGSDKLQRELEQIKDLLLRGTTAPLLAAVGAPRGLQPVSDGSPRSLNAQTFDLPRFDADDLDTLVLSKDTSTNSAQNFLNSMLALQG
jgi:hypothetical protein